MSENEKKPVRYRRYLVDKSFQLKYTVLVVGISGLIYGVLGYLLYRRELANSEILEIQNIDVQQLVELKDIHTLYYLAAFFVLQVVALSILGIFLTHRIAGPLHRVQKYLAEAAGSGTLKPLERVRSQDEFSDFFDTLGRVVDKFHEKEGSHRKRLEKLASELEKVGVDPDGIKRCRAICDELLTKS